MSTRKYLPEPEPPLTLAEAAKLLRINYRRAVDLAARGLIPGCYRLCQDRGCRWYVARMPFFAFLATGRREAA